MIGMNVVREEPSATVSLLRRIHATASPLRGK